MPKASKSNQCEQHTIEQVLPKELSEQEETSSDQEVFFNPQPSTSKKAQVMPSMYMPYIEGPTMDWTMNDGLYNRFVKWRLKCEYLLECELAMLPEARKCKKIVAWSGDFCLDQYISLNLSSKDLTLEVIWKKFEEFCKLQTNELRAIFDLLTSLRQADMSVDKWYNAGQTQVAQAMYPQETAQILQGDIFWFFLKDESFVFKTLNEWHVELSKFPASTVCQLTKKMESSQTTAKHMKQVARDPQAVQVDLL